MPDSSTGKIDDAMPDNATKRDISAEACASNALCLQDESSIGESRNLATASETEISRSSRCCCLSSLLMLAVCAALAAFALHTCSPVRPLESAAKKYAETAAKIAAMPPLEKTVITVKFLGAAKTDKYIVAQLDENFSTTREAVKWKTFSAKVEYSSEVQYKYYVPFASLKISARKTRDGKIDFVFSFPELKLDTPVGESNRKISVSQSKFSNDANKSVDTFVSAEIPKLIEENGRDYYRMLAAKKEAQSALKSWAQNVFLPLLNLPKDLVGNVEIKLGQKISGEGANAATLTFGAQNK